MAKRIKAGKWVEWAVLILFISLYCTVTSFHEPWFDEAQAWQIAKCADLKTLLFEIPHYEGHPPLWHLILAIPAKLGIPFEIGLKTVGLLISATAAALLLFRSKLPRYVRLILPFSYFFFYQYGVIVRPYGLMLLVMLALGMQMPNRRQHPWRVAVLLALLCMTGAFGILFAGGISLCIVWDVVREKGLARAFRELFSDPQSLSMLALLAVALAQIALIIPRENTYAKAMDYTSPLPMLLICAFLVFPSEVFLTTSRWFSTDLAYLQALSFDLLDILPYALLGLTLWIIVVCASSRRTLKYFLVPYILLSLFASTVYFTTHHIGVVFVLALFWAEYVAGTGRAFERGRWIRNRLSQTERDVKLLNRVLAAVIGACLIIPLYWSVGAIVHDIQYDYCFARTLAAFIREKGLDELRIMCQWNDEGSFHPESDGHEDYVNPYLVGVAVPVSSYFDKNIAFNLNGGNDEEAFVYHIADDYEKSQAIVEQWREQGPPDVFVGYPNLQIVYGDDVTSADYTCVVNKPSYFIWKAGGQRGITLLYVKNELIEPYHLEPQDDTFVRYRMEGFRINDEVRAAYESGVPLDDILKPYLDAMFGEEQ